MRLKKRMGKPGFLVGWESTSRQNKTRTTKSVVRVSILVAGEGFEPPTFGL